MNESELRRQIEAVVAARCRDALRVAARRLRHRRADRQRCCLPMPASRRRSPRPATSRPNVAAAAAAAAVLAGTDAAEPAFRHRHQRRARGAASSTNRSPATTPTASLVADPRGRDSRAWRTAGSGRRPTTIWKLKRGVTWHDGRPFTADDVVFNWQFATDPATAAPCWRLLPEHEGGREVDAAHRALRHRKAEPALGRAATASPAADPEPSLRAYLGARIALGTANLKPVGTGPYRCVDFKPGDLVRGEINPNYHQRTGPTSTPSSSRAAATPRRRRARCCRPASPTSPGTCRSRTTCCGAWRTAAKGRCTSRPAARSSSSSSPGTTPTRKSTASAAAPSRVIRCGATPRCDRR